jgi:hypothetical protein
MKRTVSMFLRQLQKDMQNKKETVEMKQQNVFFATTRCLVRAYVSWNDSDDDVNTSCILTQFNTVRLLFQNVTTKLKGCHLNSAEETQREMVVLNNIPQMESE